MAAYASGLETHQALASDYRAGHGVGQEEAEDAAWARPPWVGPLHHAAGVVDDPSRVVQTCPEAGVVEEGFQDLPLGSCGPGLEDDVRSFALQDVVVAAVVFDAMSNSFSAAAFARNVATAVLLLCNHVHNVRKRLSVTAAYVEHSDALLAAAAVLLILCCCC